MAEILNSYPAVLKQWDNENVKIIELGAGLGSVGMAVAKRTKEPVITACPSQSGIVLPFITIDTVIHGYLNI